MLLLSSRCACLLCSYTVVWLACCCSAAGTIVPACVLCAVQVPDELVLHLLRRSGDEANDKEL